VQDHAHREPIKLQETKEERDLGVAVANSLESSAQCSKATSKAMSILGIIRRYFKRLNGRDFLLLYKTYVRSYLEHCVQAWSPYLVKDIQCLERVQQRATKLLGRLKNEPFEK
jgi:DNA-binding protein Fis